MNQEDNGKQTKKEAMKKLRADRKQWIVKATAQMKAQKKALKAITACLAKGACTVPEVADATTMPADEVLWYMAALKKYGKIVEAEKDGEYFRYALTEAIADVAACDCRWPRARECGGRRPGTGPLGRFGRVGELKGTVVDLAAPAS